MNIDPNLDDYPRLVPPKVVYEHKDSLKKQATVIPLFVKIASAAAAVALLIGLFWWRSATPTQSLMAELDPIAPQRVVTDAPEIRTESQVNFVVPKRTPSSLPKPQEQRPFVEREALPMLAGLPPQAQQLLSPTATDPSFTNLAIPAFVNPALPEGMDEEYLAYSQDDLDDDRSFLRKGFQKMTDGQYEGFGDLLINSWRMVKVELAQLNESMSDGFDALKNNSRF